MSIKKKTFFLFHKYENFKQKKLPSFELFSNTVIKAYFEFINIYTFKKTRRHYRYA